MKESDDKHKQKAVVLVAIPAFALAFGPVYKKVRFPNSETALRGFSLLLHSGGGETFGDNTYGLSSARQIELLEKNGIQFKIVS